jgi:hypothetical protein
MDLIWCTLETNNCLHTLNKNIYLSQVKTLIIAFNRNNELFIILVTEIPNVEVTDSYKPEQTTSDEGLSLPVMVTVVRMRRIR